MSGTSSSHAELTRRSFLKASGAAAGALGLAGAAGMTAATDWLAPAQAHAEPEERVAHTFHQNHCGGMCSLKCTVRDGRLVLIEPNELPEGCKRYETVCMRGLSEVQHVYGEGRIQTPLKRTGERGSGEFVAVSWDDALDEIAEKLKEIQDAHGKDSVLVKTTSEATFPHLAALLGATTGGRGGIDIGVGNGLDPAVNKDGANAFSTAEIRDWVNSKLIINCGNNILESSVVMAKSFYEAKEAGARIVTVDPHFSTTASKSDEWIAIEPGTDAALFLAMTTHILNEGLADEEYMLARTALPFLVDQGTGKLVRDHAEDANAKQAETGEQNAYFVIDAATGQVVPHNQAGVTAVLKGSVVQDGVAYRTVYDMLLETQKPYTPDWAAEITGIPAEKIIELAESYADGPASLSLGWGGNDKFSNADISGHAAAVLGAVTGNMGVKGGNVGCFLGGVWTGHAASLGAWKLPEEYKAAKSNVDFIEMAKKESAIRAMINCGDQVAQKLANMNAVTEWVSTLDLVVSIDAYFTEGCKWADYVLPATSRFELEDEVGQVRTGYNLVETQEKVLDPLFEAKSDLQIQKEIAKRFGLDHLLPASSVEYAQAQLANSKDPYYNKLTLQDFAANNGVVPMEGIEEPRFDCADGTFNTLSGRVDLYYDAMVPFDQALPKWEACSEAYYGNPLRETYPFQLTNARTRFRIHSQFCDAKWIDEIFEPTCEVNPVDMQAKGLETGDVIEVFNDRGSFLVKASANPSIRPGTVRFYEGVTSDYVVSGNMQTLTNDYYPERGFALKAGPVIPFGDTLCDIRKA